MVSFDFSNISTDQMLYSEKDLEKSMDKIETVNFHQVSECLCVLVDCEHVMLGSGCEWD